MIRLSTPREVIDASIAVAQKNYADAPEGGLGRLMAIRSRMQERGMLGIAMSAASVEALLEEVADEVAGKAEAERRHVESFEST